MAYSEPTASDLKARYAAFTGVSDATVNYWLLDAHRYVDTSWMEWDYSPALIARAAHDMIGADVAGIANNEIDTLAGSGLTSFKSGTFSATFSEAAATQAADGGLTSTRYGREYLALLRRNRPSFGVSTPGVAPWGCSYRHSLLG